MSEVLWDRETSKCLLWWRISPTLRCTCDCSYCGAQFRPAMPATTAKRRHLSPDDWIRICRKFGTDNLLITGGEPFLYIGLAEIIEGIFPSTKVRINSNLCPARPDVLKRITERGNVDILATYHEGQPGMIPVEQFAEKVKMIREGGIFCRVNLIARDKRHAKRVLQPLKKQLIEMCHPSRCTIVPDIRKSDAWPGCANQRIDKLVDCWSGCLRLVGPDGFRYPCQSKLIRNVGQMEDLLSNNPSPMDYTVRCADFGMCLPCDRHGPRTITAVD